MEMVKEIEKMAALSQKWHQAGKIIAFVPTMGYFHQGHLSLMGEGKKQGDVLVVSLFVNPIQFGPKEDLAAYPRNLQRDASLAEKEGTDVLFVPEEKEMYPEGYQTYVKVTQLTKYLCGVSRPGHFKGVTTVVAKLFNIIRPHIAIFGLKDYQQYIVIKRMVRDLNYPIKIIGCPIVRETDGLAMSSRNVYLTSEQRPSALSLYKSLNIAQEMVNKGERKAKNIIKAVSTFIQKHPYTKIDYVKLCHPETLEDLEEIKERALLALAVKVGKARLIDNTILGVK
ncbi:pantoate--beta-alanine ligase [Candidatus Desulfofervidus auxilii]|uniref:Pantothenate synthetase n=2 Tax=Desulfofervidus auxilii TaxID=1621989 RepID=A0A7U4QL67_DESA2|nr:pantoate--beta-alanine ligase [Candidatus Desulfofervidus auxilii]